MSRIQDILNKAERDGTARRTRPLAEEYAVPPATEAPLAREVRDTLDQGRVPEAASAAPTPTLPPRVARRLARKPAQPHAPAASERVLAGPPAAEASAIHATVPRVSRAIDVPTAAAMTHGSVDLDPHLVAALAPTSLAAEQYRSLRTRLKRVESGRVLRTLAITSPAKGDGKSLTAANLSLTMAQEVQQRVLLVDCDLRRPSIHSLFGLDEGTGLVDVLMNAVELDQALVWLPEHQLTVLPAGLSPSNPAELLGSATMRRTLDTLRTRFDRILIDVPPVAPLADLHVLAPLVDGVLMIVRAGITPKPAIERALAGLDPTKVLGLVLNEAGGANADSDAYAYDGYGYIAG